MRSPDALRSAGHRAAPSAGRGDVVTQSEYDIEGDSVYMNIDVEILGQTFRLKGVKLTEKSACMQNWDKESKSWVDSHADTMSIIHMIRTHGSSVVADNCIATAKFGMQGEKNAVQRDPIAEMLLAKEAEAAAKVAAALAPQA